MTRLTLVADGSADVGFPLLGPCDRATEAAIFVPDGAQVPPFNVDGALNWTFGGSGVVDANTLPGDLAKVVVDGDTVGLFEMPLPAFVGRPRQVPTADGVTTAKLGAESADPGDTTTCASDCG